MSEEPRDWTRGAEGIAFQRCSGCGHAWYFRRSFCPACGAPEPRAVQASGAGRVHAVTEVARAPSEALRARAPYCIALVDADEGFRLMAHVERGTHIGDRVQARFLEFGGRPVPVFFKANP
ncbi:MAG: Zn-ribbon domain-containing OB-fold protein [Betaproteobacteria bacterium]|jgi:uncharacterized OB-fold protein|nr:OB-fold domain-containing protein [Rhodocyclaceae bacterium]MCA3134617.1 OB-fold domain-containing protein [Rhodocyclaceae bacterium]MCA3143083.1 OB-fold domain-containing protein [Rhodocyclaceae bacterium]MCA3144559.1 OB-fold domain-containing protein [Rhodocyclaceae bacterium]MCE2898164.1 OB-fold domain-containing protein [Betaproteobacteria bacterium]